MPEHPLLINSEISYYSYALLSHKGRVRANNEDRLAVREFVTQDTQQTPILLSVLCDGVGGHLAGETAAQIGVAEISVFFAGCDSFDQPSEILSNAIIAANQAIVETASRKPGFEGMAATCICACIVGQKLFIANLGDSRAYLMRKGGLHQLSYDHTWLEESMGINRESFPHITRDHPLAHVLSRYLGGPHPPNVDIRLRFGGKSRSTEINKEGFQLKSNDCLLLCSDGLTDLLNEKEISACLQGIDPRKDAQRLVISALGRGGHDNVSVIVIYYV